MEIVTTSNEKPVPRWYQELAAKAGGGAGGGGGDATDRHAKVCGGGVWVGNRFAMEERSGRHRLLCWGEGPGRFNIL